MAELMSKSKITMLSNACALAAKIARLQTDASPHFADALDIAAKLFAVAKQRYLPDEGRVLVMPLTRQRKNK